MEGTATVSDAPAYGSGATLQYNRSANQAAGPEWVSPLRQQEGEYFKYRNCNCNSIKSFNAGSPLTIVAGATLDNGGFPISGSATLTVVDGGTLQLSGTSTFPVLTLQF
jgi:hypothetical protein